MSKIWLVTGASRGFGKEFARAAAARGDFVVATARQLSPLADLVAEYQDHVTALALDVTDRAAVEDVVKQAHNAYGRLDVVVNNAGYGLFGAVEELSEENLREQMETNFFGAVWVTQAVLPILRDQGSGHIVQVSSIGGVAAFPSLGGYHASKWALEGISESLAAEVAGFGINVTLVEPGSFATDWAGSSAVRAEPLGAYQPMREQMAARSGAAVSGDPAAAAQALLRVVDADQPPLRVLFGAQPLQLAPHLYQQRLATWDEWADVAKAAEGS